VPSMRPASSILKNTKVVLSIVVQSPLQFARYPAIFSNWKSSHISNEPTNHWPFVRARPGCPLELNGPTGSDCSRSLSIGSSLVTNDIWVIKCRWRNKTIVLVFGNGPSHDYWSNRLMLERWVITQVAIQC